MCSCGASLDVASVCFCDWLVSTSPCVAEPWTSFVGAENSISSFNEDIDIVMQDARDSALPSYRMSSGNNWSAFKSSRPSPFLPVRSPPSILSDATGFREGSSMDFSPIPLSPASAYQSPFSPIPDSLSDFTSVSDEAHHENYGNAVPFPSRLDFFYPGPSSLSSAHPFTAQHSSYCSHSGYGQQTSQYDISAATPVVSGLGSRGVQGNANTIAFPYTPPAPSPIAGQDAIVTLDKIVIERKHDNEEMDDAKPRTAKTRARQDTTRKYECPECGSKWARTHNLKVHVDSKHKKIRNHVCSVPGCNQPPFSRKHDLTRHIQSKHTNLGSPRRKSPKATQQESE